MGPDERAIRDANAAWIDAVNAGDLPKLLTMMADDMVLLNPGQAPLGREGFPEVFSAGHAQGRLRCESDVDEVVVSGDLAYMRAKDTVTLTPHAGGGPQRFVGYRITIWRKRSDGRWVLSRDANAMAPA